MLGIAVRTALITLGLWALILLLWMLARVVHFPMSEGFLGGLMVGTAGGSGSYFANSVTKRKRNLASKSESPVPM
jgi:hypothetical protein